MAQSSENLAAAQSFVDSMIYKIGAAKVGGLGFQLNVCLTRFYTVSEIKEHMVRSFLVSAELIGDLFNKVRENISGYEAYCVVAEEASRQRKLEAIMAKDLQEEQEQLAAIALQEDLEQQGAISLQEQQGAIALQEQVVEEGGVEDQNIVGEVDLQEEGGDEDQNIQGAIALQEQQVVEEGGVEDQNIVGDEGGERNVVNDEERDDRKTTADQKRIERNRKCKARKKVRLYENKVDQGKIGNRLYENKVDQGKIGNRGGQRRKRKGRCGSSQPSAIGTVDGQGSSSSNVYSLEILKREMKLVESIEVLQRQMKEIKSDLTVLKSAPMKLEELLENQKQYLTNYPKTQQEMVKDCLDCFDKAMISNMADSAVKAVGPGLYSGEALARFRAFVAENVVNPPPPRPPV